MNDKLNVTVGIIAFTRGTGRIGITRAQAGQALGAQGFGAALLHPVLMSGAPSGLNIDHNYFRPASNSCFILCLIFLRCMLPHSARAFSTGCTVKA